MLEWLPELRGKLTIVGRAAQRHSHIGDSHRAMDTLQRASPSPSHICKSKKFPRESTHVSGKPEARAW